MPFSVTLERLRPNYRRAAKSIAAILYASIAAEQSIALRAKAFNHLRSQYNQH